MATGSRPRVPLHPLPGNNRNPKNLSEFIARVNAQPGGFRNLTEDALRQELELERERAAENEDVDMDREGEGEGEAEAEGGDKADAEATKDVRAVREEVLKNIEVAHNTALLTLDSISLLLTKEVPVQAGNTLSTQLRDMVGIGTLGATSLVESNITPEKLQDTKLMATGRKVVDINKTADLLLSTATKLQQEISLETQYWAEVLAVSEAGWSVARLPNERHTMGVKYGFSEGAVEFRNSSTAPMRRDDTGAVRLDRGPMDRESQRLQVLIEKGGQIVGRSTLPSPLPDDARLESRVLDARNSIFDLELWYELNREGRTLVGYGVELEDSTISYSVDAGWRVLFRIVKLSDEEARGQAEANPEDGTAEIVNAAVHVLLSYTHRQSNHSRTKMNLEQKKSNLPYNLLRPIIAYMMHNRSVTLTTRLVSDITGLMRLAGLPTATYIVRERPIKPKALATTKPVKGASSEALINALLAPFDFEIEMAITPSARIRIRGRTASSKMADTQFQIHLLPPAAGDSTAAAGGAGPAKEVNPLSSACPPVEAYPALHEVFFYIRQAVPRVLAERYEKLANQWTAAAIPDAQNRPLWIRSANNAAVRDANGERQGVIFSLWMGAEDRKRELGSPPPPYIPPELRVFGDKLVKGKPPKWTWTVEEAVNGAPKETLDRLVRHVVLSGLRRS